MQKLCLGNKKNNIFFKKNTILRACLYILILFGFWACKSRPDSFEKPLPLPNNAPNPPALILMIGDGMGLAQISAAMYSVNRSLALEEFPVIGFHKPYSSSNLITDSAAGATAFSCGLKTYNGAIGLDADTIPCRTILETAQSKGLATGIVATSTLVHATPASFMAHNVRRISYEEIALDIANSGVDFLVGGGKQYFDRREDDMNLTAQMEEQGYFVRDYFSNNINTIRPPSNKKFLFFAADNHPLPVSQGRVYLPFVSSMAAEYLEKRSEKGFFLMIEGSQIDWACHGNEGKLTIQETLDFDKAVREVLAFAKERENTMVIVTADHESGGLALNDGSKPKRVNTVFTTNGHTASIVPVFAYGPDQENFSGIYENTELYYKMMNFLNLAE